MKSHILITGGTGFIGGYLAKGLTKAGYRVTTVSRSMGNIDNHVCADLTNKKAVIDLAEKLSSVDTIIHCAALAHKQKPMGNYSTAEYNTLILNNLLSGFNRRQRRWFFMSSISVYGEVFLESMVPILSQPEPAESYGVGKLCDEQLLILKCSNLNIFRLMPVYDSYNLHDVRKRVFLPNTEVKIMVRPAPLYSLCNVEEVLAAVEKYISYECGQRIIQVGDRQPTSQSDLVNWFPGIAIPVPQLLFRSLIYILPKKFSFSRAIGFKLKKLGLNNIYESGCRELK